jgi:hypothetical protein
MYGNQPLPYTDPDLNKLSQSLMTEAINTQFNAADANKYLSFKANRPKLTRQDLMNSAQDLANARAVATGTANTGVNALLATFPSVLAGGFTPSTQALLDSARRRRQGLTVAIP